MANTKTIPYEILIRFDDEGRLRGAHIQHKTIVADDAGVIIGEIEGIPTSAREEDIAAIVDILRARGVIG